MIATAKDLRFNINMLFGLWKDRDEDVNEMVRNMRKGRGFIEKENLLYQ